MPAAADYATMGGRWEPADELSAHSTNNRVHDDYGAIGGGGEQRGGSLTTGTRPLMNYATVGGG